MEIEQLADISSLEESAVLASNVSKARHADSRTFVAFAFRTKSATVRRRSGSFFDELMRHQTLTPEKLRDLQWERASRMFQWAADATAFYPEFYAKHAIDV